MSLSVQRLRVDMPIYATDKVSNSTAAPVVETCSPPGDPNLLDSLSYTAPFLIEKLLQDHIAETAEEAEALFAEVKKYIALTQSDRAKIYAMHSLRVDVAWHQFILFTKEYAAFCHTYFGNFIHHCPSTAPRSEEERSIEVASLAQFWERYIELFGTPPSDIWNDAAAIRPTRRVLNRHPGQLVIKDVGDMIDLLSPTGEVLISVNEIARSALAFTSQTGAFYVRELPGELDDDEKAALVAGLIQCNVLRLAS